MLDYDKYIKRIKQLTEKDVIHCDTPDKAEKICNALLLSGHTWLSGQSYTTTHWNGHGSSTCYRPAEDSYCSIEWYRRNGYNIIEFNDLFRYEDCKFMKRCGE